MGFIDTNVPQGLGDLPRSGWRALHRKTSWRPSGGPGKRWEKAMERSGKIHDFFDVGRDITHRIHVCYYIYIYGKIYQNIYPKC